MLWNIWEISVNCIESLCLYWLLAKQLGASQAHHSLALWMVIPVAASITVMNMAAADVLTVFLVGTAVDVTYAVTCFRGSLLRRLIWGFVGDSIYIAANLIVASTLPFISGLDVVDTLSPSPARLGVQIAYLCVVVLLTFILSNIRSYSGSRQANGRWMLFLVLIMMVATLAAALAVSLAIQGQRSEQERNVLVVLSASILGMMVGTILLFDGMSAANARQGEAKLRARYLEAERERNQEIQTLYRAWTHDVRNTFEVLQYYAAHGDWPNLIAYLGELRIQQDSLPAMTSTGVPAVDAIISVKRIVAQGSGIRFHVHSESLADIDVSESDLSMILGNLLNNAIEACENVDANKRFIEIRIQQKGSMRIIRIANSCDGMYIRDEDGRLLSTKDGHDRGNGFFRLTQCLEATSGFYTIDAGPNVFEIKIAVPIAREKS